MSKKSLKAIHNKLNKLLENTGDMALKRRARFIVESINPQNGDRILDVGCGDGFYLHLLSNLGLKLKLQGADFDPNGLRSAEVNLKGKKIPLVQADLMKKLPFKDNSFDKVVMSEVAEHLPSDLKGIKEVLRVLKPDGIAAISVPNHNYPILWDPVNWISEHFFGTHVKSGFWAGIWNQHIRLYKPDQMKKVMEKAGFEVLNVKSLTWWSLPFNHNLVNLVARQLAGRTLSKDVASSLSKYSTTSKKVGVIDIAFQAVNAIDVLNNVEIQNIGVSLVVIGKKSR